MGFDQKGTLVFRVARGKDNKWNVNETGFDKPLASFDNEKDARTYADDLAKTKPGSKVVVEGGAAATSSARRLGGVGRRESRRANVSEGNALQRT